MGLRDMLLPAAVAISTVSITAEAPAQEIERNAQEELEQTIRKLERKLLKKFVPTNISQRSEYMEAFKAIRFVLNHERKTLSREHQAYHDRYIDAFIRNLYVPDMEFAVRIRKILRRKGVLDHQKKLDDLVKLGDAAFKEAGRTATLTEDYDKAIEDIELRKRYVAGLKKTAESVIRLALQTRIQPEMYSDDEIDEQRIDNVHAVQEAFNHLVDTQRALDRNDTAKAFEALDEWKEQYERGLDGMKRLVRKAGATVLTEIDYKKWKHIPARIEHERSLGNSTLGTEEFAGEFQRFYEALDRFTELQEGVARLTSYLVERFTAAHPPTQGPEEVVISYFNYMKDVKYKGREFSIDEYVGFFPKILEDRLRRNRNVLTDSDTYKFIGRDFELSTTEIIIDGNFAAVAVHPPWNEHGPDTLELYLKREPNAWKIFDRTENSSKNGRLRERLQSKSAEYKIK